MQTVMGDDRRAHWIKKNHQCRIPGRWVAFDSESRVTHEGNTEIQDHMISAAVRWRHGLRKGDYAESRVFQSPKELWTWVTEHCRPGERTVCIAHNLGHDVRITQAFTVLPELGWQLDWFNLASNISVMKWVSDVGTLVLCDLWTWLPVKLSAITVGDGLGKLPMPSHNASPATWERYCLRDASVVYRAMSEIIAYLAENDMGNWQPTGSGMAYATWRHKYLDHKILVHDDQDALDAERAAMHTGRSEAWRHGTLHGDKWTEVDMRNAYCQIGADSELPTKLKYGGQSLGLGQYRTLCGHYRVLAVCAVRTDIPILPCRSEGRTLWPTGSFETTVWDTEIDLALENGAEVRILRYWVYTRHPVLQRYSQWVLQSLSVQGEDIPPNVRTWIKHCSRALIGRIALRTAKWEYFGDNPEGITGITWMHDQAAGTTCRLMHAGDRTLMESGRTEGKDSCPMITSWIMARCRVLLWRAMDAAGLDNVAHVDTDSLIVNTEGLIRLRTYLGAAGWAMWAPKGTWCVLTVMGPRNWRGDKVRKVSGVPVKAEETEPNIFRGERWQSLAAALGNADPGRVIITQHTWHIRSADKRRKDNPARSTHTLPIVIQ
jgi:hypothetical protein